MYNQKEKKQQCPQLSKTYYVDEQGRLCRRYSYFEKIYLKISLTLRLMPIFVSLMILGLMLTEAACFFGLFNLMQSPKPPSSDAKIYITLICLIGVILLFSIKVAFFLSEKHLQENQEFFKTKKFSKK